MWFIGLEMSYKALGSQEAMLETTILSVTKNNLNLIYSEVKR